MNCETVRSDIRGLASQTVDDGARAALMRHVETCADCRLALRGAEALVEIRHRETGEPSEQLFERVVNAATNSAATNSGKHRFWMGTCVGGAIAASIFALALVVGLPGDESGGTANTAEFVVAVNKARQMNLAFETDRQLDGAQITIILSGSIAIDGYGLQRELSWSENLKAGINRLSLPVLANDDEGGQMIVRMTHPLSEQVFIINLPTES